jgi:hypothetical protein
LHSREPSSVLSLPRMGRLKKIQFLSCSFIFLFSVHISTIDKGNICAKIFLRMTPTFFLFHSLSSPLLTYISTLITGIGLKALCVRISNRDFIFLLQFFENFCLCRRGDKMSFLSFYSLLMISERRT